MLKSKIKIIALIFPLFLLTGVVMPAVVEARGLVPCGGYSDDQGHREPPCDVNFIFAMVARVTNFLIFFAGVFAVFQIARAGFFLVISMGNEEDITTNKKFLTNAVMGFVLVMMAYIFINTVVNFLLLQSLPADSPLKVDLANPFKYLQNK